MLVISDSIISLVVLNSFQLGDQVILVNHPVSKAVDKFAAKLAPRFVGLFLIEELHGRVSAVLCHVTLDYLKIKLFVPVQS